MCIRASPYTVSGVVKDVSTLANTAYAKVWSYSFSSIPFYFLFFVALYVEKIEWSDLQLRCHILIKTGCKIIRIRLRAYP